MANDILGKMNSPTPTGNGNGLIGKLKQSLGQFRQNPFEFLVKQKLNIPDEMQYNPEAIVQYLMNTGQMSQQQFDYLQNMKQQIESNFK